MRIRVTFGSGIGFQPWGGDGLVLPSRFIATFDEEARPVTVELLVEVVDGEPRCMRLTCEPRAGETITGEVARALPIKSYLRHAAAAAAMRATTNKAGEVSLSPVEDDDVTILPDTILETRHRRITAEHLQEVARIYNRDKTGAPTKAVAEHFETTRQNAGKWVKAALKRG